MSSIVYIYIIYIYIKCILRNVGVVVFPVFLFPLKLVVRLFLELFYP